ncbi:cytosine permease [Rhizorhabdus phycosphaerae]|uniref:cytosine permease n=1 Tax=Rhizorhabdus phycosphaerae TaxID=2711156 RepID=UPI0013EE38C1|nr:cytosine permease [Rhizorhabdus phycosphaerae]
MNDAGDGLLEGNATQRVGSSDFRPWTFFAAIQIGTAICVPMFALGGDLGSHSRFLDLPLPVLVASSIVALMSMATGYVGMTARLPTSVFTRTTFGVAGAKLLAAVLILTLLGWFGIQIEMLARAVVGLLASQFGISVPLTVVIVASGLLVSTTGIIGVKALGKLATITVPFLLAVITVPLWLAFGRFDVAERLAAPPSLPAYDAGTIISIIAGGYMTGIAVTPDVSRFLATRRDMVLGPVVALGIVLPFLILLSASLAVIYGTGDLIGIMTRAGLAAPALAILILATWSSNDKNLYESALSLSALVPGIPRWILATGAATVGIAFAAMGIFGHFIAFLVMLGIVIAPVAGLYTVDFVLRPDRYAPSAEPETRAVRPLPFAIWALASLIGWSTLPASGGGLGLFALTGVSTLDALGAATGFYALATFGHRSLARRTAAA